jgi:hypothetical protein
LDLAAFFFPGMQRWEECYSTNRLTEKSDFDGIASRLKTNQKGIAECNRAIGLAEALEEFVARVEQHKGPRLSSSSRRQQVYICTDFLYLFELYSHMCVCG